jgi:hypothetical protein
MTVTRYRNLEKLTNTDNINYIVYNLETKEFNSYENIESINTKFFTNSNNFQIDKKILIFIKDAVLENTSNSLIIQKAIKSSSFSVSKKVEESLLKYISNHPTLNFLDDELMVIENIQTAMNKENNIQAKKYYNNIIRRLKYTRLDILEQTDTQREENFNTAMKTRDKVIKYKKSAMHKLNKNLF